MLKVFLIGAGVIVGAVALLAVFLWWTYGPGSGEVHD